MLWGKKPAHLHLLPTSRTNTFSQVCSPFNKRRRQRCTFLPPLSGDRSRDAFLLYLRRHFRLASPEAIIRTSCVTGKKRDQSVDARGRFIGRTVHTGRSRDASPQHRFGRWKLPATAGKSMLAAGNPGDGVALHLQRWWRTCQREEGSFTSSFKRSN